MCIFADEVWLNHKHYRLDKDGLYHENTDKTVLDFFINAETEYIQVSNQIVFYSKYDDEITIVDMTNMEQFELDLSEYTTGISQAAANQDKLYLFSKTQTENESAIIVIDLDSIEVIKCILVHGSVYNRPFFTDEGEGYFFSVMASSNGSVRIHYVIREDKVTEFYRQDEDYIQIYYFGCNSRGMYYLAENSQALEGFDFYRVSEDYSTMLKKQVNNEVDYLFGYNKYVSEDKIIVVPNWDFIDFFAELYYLDIDTVNKMKDTVHILSLDFDETKCISITDTITIEDKESIVDSFFIMTRYI